MCFSSVGLSIVKRSMNCEWDWILRIYENSKVKFISKFQSISNKIHQAKGKGIQTPKHLPRFYHQIWILKTLSSIWQCRISEPEVQGQVDPANCIKPQFTGKFILAHVHWHMLRQFTFRTLLYHLHPNGTKSYLFN